MQDRPRATPWFTLLGTAVAIAVLCALVAASLARWSNMDNDPVNNLGSAYQIFDEELVHRFANASRSLCSSNDEKCRQYQTIIESNNTANYLLTALVSSSMNLQSLDHFARAAMRTTALAAFLNFAIAIAIFLFVLSRVSLPCVHVIVLFVLTCAFFQIFGANKWSPIPSRLLDSPVALTLSLSLTGAAFWTMNRLPGLRGWVNQTVHRFEGRNIAVLALTALVTATIVPVAVMETGFRFDRALLLGAFLCLFAISTFRTEIHWADATIIAVAFVILASPETLAFVSRPSPKGQLALAAVPLLSFLFFRPDSRLAALLPALFLFHTSVAALVSVGVFAAELVVCCLMRRTTRLLWWSLGSSAIGYAISKMGVTGWGTFEPSGLLLLLSDARNDPVLTMATVAIGTGYLAAGIWIMRKRDAPRLALARVVFLLGISFVLSRISSLIGANYPLADYHPQLTVLYEATKYFTRAIFPIGMLTMIVAWLMLSTQPVRRPAPSWNAFRNWPAVLSFVALLAIGVRTGGAPTTIGDRIAETWQIVWWPEAVDLRNPRLDLLSYSDDVYLLQRVNPTNNALTYLSLLKLRMRVSNGTFDPNMAQIRILD